MQLEDAKNSYDGIVTVRSRFARVYIPMLFLYLACGMQGFFVAFEKE